MAHNISQSNINADTWLTLINEVNICANTISEVVVTAASNSSGETTTGNVVINGAISAQTLIASGNIRGGTVQLSGQMNVISNTVIGANGVIFLTTGQTGILKFPVGGDATFTVNGTANIYGNVSIGNSTVNTQVNGSIVNILGQISLGNNTTYGPSLLVTSNSTIGSEVNATGFIIGVGNPVNTQINSSSISTATGILSNGITIGANVHINASSLIMGANLVVNTTGVSTPALTVNGLIFNPSGTITKSFVTVFTTSGTYHKNANLIWADIIVVGAGGNGTSLTGTGGTDGIAVGGGGGGGSTAIKKLQNNVIGTNEQIVVGIPQTSGNSSFGNTGSAFTPIIAGSGLTSSGYANSSAYGGSIGSGGFASGGDLNLPGEDGQQAVYLTITGDGGSSTYGQGGRGFNVQYFTAVINGNIGKNYGAGGAGSAVLSGVLSSAQGGVGAHGVVIVIEYYTG